MKWDYRVSLTPQTPPPSMTERPWTPRTVAEKVRANLVAGFPREGLRAQGGPATWIESFYTVTFRCEFQAAPLEKKVRIFWINPPAIFSTSSFTSDCEA